MPPLASEVGHFAEIVDWIGRLFESAGILVVVIGCVAAFQRYVRTSPRGDAAYRVLRRQLGRGILLGLELLVAGDIIRTITVDPSLESAAVLGLIVLIRTFLSFTLEVEIDGRWPWNAGRQTPPAGEEP